MDVQLTFIQCAQHIVILQHIHRHIQQIPLFGQTDGVFTQLLDLSVQMVQNLDESSLACDEHMKKGERKTRLKKFGISIHGRNDKKHN